MFSKITFLIIFLLPVLLNNQIKILVPDSISVFINNTEYNIRDNWLDSLVAEANEQGIKYQITGWYVTGKKAITNLKIPQTLTISEVIRQVILYYSLKSNENDKHNDSVHIYPYCDNDKKQTYITCRYASCNQFSFTVKEWPFIRRLHEPRPEEKYLYQQVTRRSLEKGDPWNIISKGVYQYIAEKNSISIDTLKAIYQRVLLWQVSR